MASDGTALQTILATAALTPDRGRVAALAAGADPRGLVDELARLRLLPLLGGRLVELAPALDPRVAAAVDEVTAVARRDAVAKQMETWRVVRLLEGDGIATMPLKGPFLAERLHGDGAARQSHDIDVLVGRDDLPRAVAIVDGAGYVRPRVSDELPKLHHIFVSTGLDLELELHWRVHWSETGGFAEGILRRSRPGPDGVRCPLPADDLLLLLAAYARDGLLGLRTPVDVAAWWHRHGAGAAPIALGEHPELAQSLSAAARCVETLLGVPLSRVVAPVPLTRRTRAAVRLADWRLEGSEGEAATRAAVVDGLLTPARQSGAYLSRHVFPPLPGPPRTLRARQLLHAGGLLRRAAPLAVRARR